MATVTGYTAERMKEIEDGTVVDGHIVGGDLILITNDGTELNAGPLPTTPIPDRRLFFNQAAAQVLAGDGTAKKITNWVEDATYPGSIREGVVWNAADGEFDFPVDVDNPAGLWLCIISLRVTAIANAPGPAGIKTQFCGWSNPVAGTVATPSNLGGRPGNMYGVTAMVPTIGQPGACLEVYLDTSTVATSTITVQGSAEFAYLRP